MKFKDWIGKEHILPKNKTFSWRPAAYGLIIKNNQVLLIKAKVHGRWELPGGGIGLNETIIEALHREVHEETGYKILIKNEQPLYIEDSYFYAPDLDKYFKSIPMVFLAEPKGNNKNAKLIHEEEVEEVKWFSLNKLPKLINPMTVKAIKKYKEEK